MNKFLGIYKTALPFMFVFALVWTGYRTAVYQYNRDRCIDYVRTEEDSWKWLRNHANGMDRVSFEKQCRFFGMGGL